MLAMANKGANTSARMVEAMLQLIQTHGYAGAGLNAVLEAAEAPKGSMYFHFPGGKEELGERAIALAAEQFLQFVAGVSGQTATPGQVITLIMELLARQLVETDFTLGCPVSVVTLEMSAHSERLRAGCAEAYESWITAVADLLTTSGIPKSRVRALAETIVSTVEGAIVLSRATRDTRPMRSVASVLAPMVDGHLGARGKR